MKKTILLSIALVAGSLSFSGCVTSNTAGGAAVGAGTGALIAKAVGGNTSDAITAGAAGMVAGSMIGKELDDQERENRRKAYQ